MRVVVVGGTGNVGTSVVSRSRPTPSSGSPRRPSAAPSSTCPTTQNTGVRKGASLFGYTHLYGGVPGGQAEYVRVPQAHFGPVKVPEGPPDVRFLFLRAMAGRWGAETLDFSDHDVVETMFELTKGRMADSVIDAVGMEAAGSLADSVLATVKVQADKPVALHHRMLQRKDDGCIKVVLQPQAAN